MYVPRSDENVAECMSCELYQQASFRSAAGDEFRPGGLRLTEELAVGCGLLPGERVLDLACGAGSTASYLRRCRQAKVAGLDTCAAFLDEARRRDGEVDWVLGPAEALPFADACFDVVFAECFLSMAADPEGTLREIRRVLRPGGRLALSALYLRNPDASSIALAPPDTCLRGAVPLAVTLARRSEVGFAVRFWEDRAEAVKSLVVSLTFSYGSTEEFWRASGGGSASGEGLRQLRDARPGYYILGADNGC